MAPIVAFDTKEVNRPGFTGSFFALIGVGIEIDDYAQFCSEYDETLKYVTETFKLIPTRKVYSSYLLSSIIGRLEAEKFIEIFYTKLKSRIDCLHVFFTMISPKKLSKIYQTGEDKLEILSPKDFMIKLNTGYPHICAWKYSTIKDSSPSILLDHFNSYLTLAWESLKEKNPKIYTHGDACNRAVSFADMLVNLIDAKSYYTKEKFGDENLQTVLREMDMEHKITFIGQPDLKNITPTHKQEINTSRFVKQPVIFYVSEGKPELFEYEDARYFLERSPAIDYLSNLACDLDGSLKFYQKRQDGDLFHKNAKVAFVGPKGKDVAIFLEQNYGMEPIDLSEILK